MRFLVDSKDFGSCNANNPQIKNARAAVLAKVSRGRMASGQQENLSIIAE